MWIEAVIIAAIVIAAVFAVIAVVRRKKTGKGDCAHCPYKGTDKCDNARDKK